MKNLSISIVLSSLLFYVACGDNKETPKDENPAVTVIRKSIMAHGGWDDWIQMQELDYAKSILMYDSSGELESKTIEIHNYKFQPNYSGAITWSTDKIYRVTYDDGGAMQIIDGIPQLDGESIVDAHSRYRAAHYVLFQPWRLFDPGVKLLYLGKDQLDDSTTVDVVKVLFTEGLMPGEEHDTWWFYIDEKTSLVAGYLVHHDNRLSYIRNVSYDSTMPLTFAHHRYSHFVTDTARSNKLLRAEYFYDNFELR